MTFSVAPMMKWTDKHCRYFHRILSKKAILFSEMISVDALVFGPADRLLHSNFKDKFTVIQVGGNNPKTMVMAAKKIEKLGVSEINLNVGCPSNRVKSGNFGACLMASPKIVSDCVTSILNETNLNVSIKCRIGIDDMGDEGLDRFVYQTSMAGVKKFVIHARKAILDGLSPKENREIPPLNYKRVKKLKIDNENLEIILNGGIINLQQGINSLKELGLDGFMIGREAYKNPYILSDVDAKIFKSSFRTKKSRRDVAFEIAKYIDNYLYEENDFVIIRHILGLYNNMPGARKWRSKLVNKEMYRLKGDKLRFATDEIEKFIYRNTAA